MVRVGAERADPQSRAPWTRTGRLTIEAELSASGRVTDHGQPAERAPPRRSPPGVADHSVLSRGHRCGPRAARRSDAGSSTRPWRWSTPRPPGDAEEVDKILRQRTALLRAHGKEDRRDRHGDHARRVGRPARCCRDGPGRGPGGAGRRSWRRSPGTTTRAWPARPPRSGPRVPPVVDGSAARRPGRVAVPGSRAGLSRSTGPHRDDLALSVGGLPGRTHASQGEQRSLALALRLAAHQLATERLGSAPVLLLDDVFSELDPFRSSALLAGLPPGQALLTTALAGSSGGGGGQGLRGGGAVGAPPRADGREAP